MIQNAIVVTIVAVIFSCTSIVMPVNADSHFVIDNISPFESPFGTISVNATIIGSSSSLPVYHGVFGENDSINMHIKQVVKERKNVTTRQEAPAVARRAMELYGGLPQNAVLKGASTTYSEIYNHTLNATTYKEPMFTTITYSRDINGLWIVGDESNRIILALGENGELLWLFKIWRDYTYTGDAPLIPVATALEKLQRGEILSGPMLSDEKITIDSASPGYYTKSLPNNETDLEPIWMLFGDTESGSRVGFYVYARKFANFTATPTTALTGNPLQFTDTSDASPIKWLWDFGDGTNSTDQSPVHAYNAGGNYSVTLTAWNDLGSDSVTRNEYITIYPDLKPAANFEINFTSDHQFSPLVVSCNDTSEGYLTNWSWDFGDGTNSTERNLTHIFNLIPGDIDDFYQVSLTVTDTFGRSSTTSEQVYVLMDYHANFTAEPHHGPAPLNVTFTDTSPPLNKIRFELWDFGDDGYYMWNEWNGGSPPQTVFHEYAVEGNYSVTLYIMPFYHNGGSDQTKTDIIYVVTPHPPDANFTTNTSSGKVPLAVSFTDTSAGVPTGWNWSFGDGSHSDEQNPVHSYTVPGNYTVCLQATNIDGNDSEIRPDYISVRRLSLPISSFTGTPLSGKVPLSVTFNDTSSGSPATWTWDFGDGTTSPDQNPVHTYSSAGNFTVILTATNTDGSNITTKADYISVLPLVPPVAAFTVNATTGKTPLAVSFTDTSSGSPSGWNWTFGDGATSTEQNPVHVYTTTGQFTVTLQVTNPDGSNMVTREQFISGSIPALPVAQFIANRTTGNTPLTVGFTDQSTGSPAIWHWTFGDGSVSAEQNPSHTYTAAGIYTVSLKATNADGSNTVTKTGYITVSAIPPPTASFTGKPTSGKAPLAVTFNETSSGTPTTWSWDFGDGSTATLRNPIHTYTAAGKYTVLLTVTNAGGSNMSTRKDYITVSGSVCPPVASFSATPSSGKVPLTVAFTDSSSGSPTSWNWVFGDGANATGKNPAHIYTIPGKYTVSLTVTNAGGSNTKTRTEYITVKAISPPAANFVANPTTGKAPLAVTLNDTSTGSPTGWYWNFGDGTFATEQHPVHRYSAAGRYSVALTASNAGGNTTKTRSQYITVSAPTPTPTPTPTCTQNQCEPHTVPQVTGAIENGKIRLNWNVISNPCLQGYKVVISKSNPYPKYPDDGYMFWITNRNTNTSVIDSTMHYNGGDFGGYLQPGQAYYFSITAVYSDSKVPGNVIQITYPGSARTMAALPSISPELTLTPMETEVQKANETSG
jgi:PKD repeat protein